jgi:hypothetical protein
MDVCLKKVSKAINETNMKWTYEPTMRWKQHESKKILIRCEARQKLERPARQRREQGEQGVEQSKTA